MIQLVRAELLKLRTTQVWIWMLLLAIAVGVLAVVATLASKDVKSAADVPLLFANANGAIVTAFILGVLGITTEFPTRPSRRPSCRCPPVGRSPQNS